MTSQLDICIKWQFDMTYPVYCMTKTALAVKFRGSSKVAFIRSDTLCTCVGNTEKMFEILKTIRDG